MIEISFLIAVLVSAVCAVRVYRKMDFEAAIFQVVWIVMIVAWYIQFSVNNAAYLAQVTWCVWSIHAALLISNISVKSKVNVFAVLFLLLVPLVVPNINEIQVIWSITNIIAAAVGVFYVCRNVSDNWLKSQAFVYVLGFWLTDIIFIIAVNNNPVEPTLSWWYWEALETTLIYLLVTRIRLSVNTN